MASSNISIANRALQKLGQSRKLESLTQDHPNARTLSLAFEPVRSAEIRRYDWAFAIKRDAIAADSSQTTWGSWNRYSLPDDYIRLLMDDETGQRTDWRIEGAFIVTADSSPLYIRYLADISDPNLFDALFAEAFAAKLGLETCQEITGSTSLVARCQADYDYAIAEARRVGAIEKRAQDFPEDAWLNARL